MINLICLLVGVGALIVGFGYIRKPRKMARVQAKVRKKIEKLEKKMIKSHRITGLSYVLAGTVFLLTVFHPVWIFNLFVVARLISGFLFPSFFVPASTVQVIVPTLWI